MAEVYFSGKNRIFYRAKGFREPSIVTVSIVDSNLNKSVQITLTKVESILGLYYLDFNFCEGIYIAYFYENEELEPSASQAYYIRKESISGFRTSPGDNVINV